jgi:mRNA interferase HigB
MRVVGRQKLDVFCGKHTDLRKWVAAWLSEVEGASWRTPQAVKDRYVSASFLAANTVVFNVKGNEYRMEVDIAYRMGVVTVRWIGTHAEYDRRNKGH